ncbi:hypothetical protein BANRA_02926 [Escherichia coli]|nr:hypothetical protein BANRA_02926 [Escherichia coli]
MEILPQRSDTLDKQELNLKSDRKEKNSQELNLMVNVIFRGDPKTV